MADLIRIWRCPVCEYESQNWFDFVDKDTHQGQCPNCETELS